MTDKDFLGDLFNFLDYKKRTRTKSPVQNHILRGDSLILEEICEGGMRYVMKVSFPKNQFVTIPDGTKKQAVRYFSPADNAKRIIYVAYINGRCRIEMPQ